MSSDLQNQLQELLGSAYRIERELGGAGMSRVFVATDIGLDRQVVIKVLPPELAAGINIDRFRREIQLAARLQHPHIVPLHAAGAKESLLYYTMPFIVGENLRVRLNKAGDLPVQETTKILREVADALSYAHSQGVVHRDIKPENILLSGNHAFVADFGVSKALSNATSETPADAPSLTSLGIALGTPAYMAPEQAAADPMIDARADIYALGIVGYELLTGRTPFAGLNQQQTLAAHITTPPTPITQHRPQLPAGLAAAIMRCIEKRPSDRFQSGEELHAALEPYSMTSGANAPSSANSPAKIPFQWTPQRIAVAAAILGLIATGLIASTIAFRRNTQTLSVGTTRQVTNAPGLEILPRISPDGQFIAYNVSSEEKNQLFVKQLAGGRPILIADTGAFPAWKPDASEILYTTARGHNYTVPALGGVPTPVPGLEGLGVCSYSNDAQRIACVKVNDQSLVIASANGDNQRIVEGTASGDGVMMPSWSADDKLIAFSRGNQSFFIGPTIGNIAPSSIWVVRADGGKPVRISDDAHLNVSPVWTPHGSIVYISSRGGNRDIYIQRIAGDLSARDGPGRLTTGLNAHTVSVDRSGKVLVYSVFTTNANVWSSPIVSADSENPRLQQITTGNQTIESASVSWDGKWLVYDSNVNDNQDIFKLRIAGGDPQQLTHNGVDNFAPTFSPDGSLIAYHTLMNGNRDIYVMDASGANRVAVTATPSQEIAPSWAPDGQSLLIGVLPDSSTEIPRDPRSPNGWGKPRPARRIPIAAISPDGTRILAGANVAGVCPECTRGLYLLSRQWSNPVAVNATKVLAMHSNRGTLVWSRDSRHAYIALNENDGTSAIWQLPIGNDAERRVFHLNDPARQFYRPNLDMDSTNFYFSIGGRQSDIWTIELKK